jgi:hypothetical protein
MRRFAARRLAPALAAASLLAAALAVPALADPRDFSVVNGSSVTLTHLFVSPSDEQQWGDDILGRDVLNPSESVDVTFRGFDGSTCLYDIKVLGQQGQQGVLYKVDLCSSSTVTFSDA